MLAPYLASCAGRQMDKRSGKDHNQYKREYRNKWHQNRSHSTIDMLLPPGDKEEGQCRFKEANQDDLLPIARTRPLPGTWICRRSWRWGRTRNRVWTGTRVWTRNSKWTRNRHDKTECYKSDRRSQPCHRFRSEDLQCKMVEQKLWAPDQGDQKEKPIAIGHSPTVLSNRHWWSSNWPQHSQKLKTRSKA